MSQRDRETLLVLGPEERARSLAGLLSMLGFRANAAAELEPALRLAAAAATPLRVGLVAGEHGIADLEAALRELARRAPITWIAFGRRLDEVGRSALRRAGVSGALFDPFTDEELRFVVNDALHAASGESVRKVDRVPADLRARVVAKTGERIVIVYNLSRAGAYLATPRPTLRGGQVELRLRLEGQELSLPAHVVWNNVPGNLRRPHAPVGMGVRFGEVEPGAAELLDRYVRERRAAYRL